MAISMSSDITGIVSAFISVTGMAASIIMVSYRAGVVREQLERKMDRLESSVNGVNVDLRHEVKTLNSDLDRLEDVVNQKLNYDARNDMRNINELILKVNKIEAYLESDDYKFARQMPQRKENI